MFLIIFYCCSGAFGPAIVAGRIAVGIIKSSYLDVRNFDVDNFSRPPLQANFAASVGRGQSAKEKTSPHIEALQAVAPHSTLCLICALVSV